MSEREAKRKLIMEWYRLKPSDMLKDYVTKESLKTRLSDK